MTFEGVFLALVIAGLLLLAGKVVRDRVRLFRSLFIPSSVIAGCFALLLGPQVLGVVIRRIAGSDHLLANGVIPAEVLEVWSSMPGILISVVFASLFLGKRIPGIRDIWLKAGPQVAFGQAVAWGQYVLGLVCALLILGPLFGMDPMSGALIEIGFEGGHGTAAGLAGTFESLGFPEGADMAMGLATFGLVAGVAAGTIMVNWAARTGRIAATSPLEKAREEAARLSEFDERETAETPASSDVTTDPLSLHIGIVGLAIAIGWLLLEGLVLLEQVSWQRLGLPGIMRYVPLFPMAMIGGIMIQLLMDRIGHTSSIDRRLMNHISGASLDFIIVAALGTLSLAALGDNIGPFAILALVGISWNVLAFLLLAPRIIPSFWFERGIGDFGQSTGMTVTGLLLIRVCDPQNRSGAMESFGYKQLLFEPVVGGGLFTAAALPLIAGLGPVAVLVITGVLCAGWILFGIRLFGKRRSPA